MSIRRYIYWAGTIGFCALSAACGEDAPRLAETTVIRKIEFNKIDGDMVSGLDLDGVDSDGRDSRSCFKTDYVSPTGEVGIDNQLATLIPLVDLTGEGALQGLVQNAVNEGRLLVFLELVEMESGAVTLAVRRGDDKPLLGTDGFVLSGQTLALHAESELGRAAGGQMAGTVVTTEPFALEMPIVVFSLLYLLELPDARMRFEVTEDGRFTNGVIAGSADIEQLLGIVKQAAMFGGDFETLLNDAIRDSADLNRDMATGKCKSLSVGINFDAVPAYVFE
jgi:hypothetical protein